MPEYQDIPDDWSTSEQSIFADLVGNEPEIERDIELQMLFHGGYFDREMPLAMREQFQISLEDYLFYEYGIDFDIEFDWEAYREWYESG